MKCSSLILQFFLILLFPLLLCTCKNETVALETPSPVVYFGSLDGNVYAVNAETGALKWQKPTGNEVYSTPSVKHETVCIGNDNAELLAFDKNSGDLLWSSPSEDLIRTRVETVHCIAFYCSVFNDIYAVDITANGKILWHFQDAPPPGSFNSNLTYYKGTVYSGRQSNTLVALDAIKGEINWSFNALGGGSGIWSIPLAVNNTIYVGATNTYVYALNAETGIKLWEFKAEKPIYSGPATNDDGSLIYIGDSSGRMYALDAENGGNQPPVWVFDTNQFMNSKPAVNNNTVFFGNYGGELYAVDAITGEKKWEFINNEDNPMPFRSSPAVYNGTIYIGNDDGNLYAVDAETGTLRWKFKTDGPIHSSPAVAWK